MDNNSFQETLKNKIDEIKEKTLSQLLSQDNEYQHACKQQGLAENNYLQLNLTEDQKEIIDQLLSWTDTSNMEYSSLSYLAGLFDSQKLFEMFYTKPSDTSSKGKLIRDFFNGKILPSSTHFESSATTNLWEEIEEMENLFSAHLSSEQLLKFEELTDKRAKRLDLSIEDSFAFGFQLAAKFVIDVLS